jgi:hypothetical protein
LDQFGEFTALAAEFSGWRRKIPLLFEKKTLKTVCSDSCIQKSGS